MKTNHTITRKELAFEIGVHVATLIRREREWGLDKCRSKSHVRPQHYFSDKARAALVAAGVLNLNK